MVRSLMPHARATDPAWGLPWESRRSISVVISPTISSWGRSCSKVSEYFVRIRPSP